MTEEPLILDEMIEQEWSDGRGTYHECRIVRSSDMLVFSKIVTKVPVMGWGDHIERARAEVRAAAATYRK